MCFCEKSQSKPGKTPRSVWNVSIVVNMNSTSPLHPACKCLCSSCVKFLPMLLIKTAQVHRSKQHQSFLNRSLKVTNRQITKKERKTEREGKTFVKQNKAKTTSTSTTPLRLWKLLTGKTSINSNFFFFCLDLYLERNIQREAPQSISTYTMSAQCVSACMAGKRKMMWKSEANATQLDAQDV